MAQQAIDRLVFTGHAVSIGEFRCPAHDAAWSSENSAERTIAVFPRVGVRITQGGRDPIVADPNCVVFYNAGQPYRRGLLSDRGDECEFFALDPTVVAEIAGAFDPSVEEHPDRPFSFDHGPSSPHQYFSQRRLYLHAAHRNNTSDALWIEEEFLLLLHDLLRAAHEVRGVRQRTPGPRAARTHIAAAEGVKELLARRTFEPLGLDEISDAVELSPFHLCRVFRARTGVSIHRYLLRLRLRAALERLSDPRVLLVQLALDLGFASHAHFTGAFRREFGLTPSAARSTLSAAQLRALSRIVESPGACDG